MDYKILPMLGFDKVKFGMNEDQVLKILGQPDEIEKEANYGDEPTDAVDVFYYDQIGVSMSFDKEAKFRLSEIAFENPEFVLEGKVHVGMSQEEALKALEAAGYEEPSMEDLEGELEPEDEGTEAYTYDEKNITLWFKGGQLETIQTGPEWFDADTIKWPE